MSSFLNDVPTYYVLGTRLYALQIPELISAVEDWIRLRQPARAVFFANAHVVSEGLRDCAFRAVLEGADVIVPDGSPLIWIGRRKGFDLPRRVYGPDFLLEFCRDTYSRGHAHFFYGGAPGVAESLAERLQSEFPGLKIAGTFSPPFRKLTPEEDQTILSMINHSGADLLWVGLGAPKQENWIHQHKQSLRVPAILAVGQAFDIHSGRRRPVPRVLAASGLEWLYRLVLEPRRLWRRYLIGNAVFLGALAKEALFARNTVTSGVKGPGLE